MESFNTNTDSGEVNNENITGKSKPGKKASRRSKRNSASSSEQMCENNSYGVGDYFTEKGGSFTEVARGLKSLKCKSSLDEEVSPVTQEKCLSENSVQEIVTPNSKATECDESTLGTTLANSLKLISTSNLPEPSSPIANCHPPSPIPSPSSRSGAHSGQESSGNFLDSSEQKSYYDAYDQSSEVNSPVLTISAEKDTNEDNPPKDTCNEKKTRGRPRRRSTQKCKEKNRESVAESSPDCVTLFQCEVCYKVFNRKQTLRQHFMTHTDRFACSFCKRRCKSKGDLRTHIQTHTKEKPFHCSICDTSYTRESILRKHLKTQLHHKALLAQNKEPKAKKTSTNRAPCKELTVPEKSLMIGGLICSKCDKVFLSQRELRMHSKVHHLKFKCTECSKRCQSAALLQIHKKCHSKTYSLTCSLCSRSFANIFLLKEHRKSHKNDVKANKNMKAEVLKAAVKKHNKKVDETNEIASKWTCGLCHKSYVSEKNLENHLRCHESLTCALCEKTFPNISKMKLHMKIHSEANTCKSYDTSFKYSSEYQEPVDTENTSTSDLRCNICYQVFTLSADLKQHMQNHAPTMLFSGGCLDESSIPTSGRSKKSNYGIPHIQIKQLSESEDNIEEECAGMKRKKSLSESDDESLVDKDDIVSLLQQTLITLEDSDVEGDIEDLEDSADELFNGIQKTLESDLLQNSDESNVELSSSATAKPMVYDHASIEQKHSCVFEFHKSENIEDNTFKCKICCLFFEGSEDLQVHMISHVCEFCNTFYAEKADLSAHKNEHQKLLLRKITCETDRFLTDRSSKDLQFQSDGSDSEIEEESDGFLSELESILNYKLNGPRFVLHALSHEDIIRANKRTFERYSCIDAANNIFACTICKRKYARPTTLTRHLKTHVCPYCNQFYEDKMDLMEHKHRHRKAASNMKTEEGFDREKVLSSPLVTKANRDMFKKFTHVDKQNNINRCVLCCKNFVRRTVLTRHMKTHICSVCDKFYEDKYDLAKHHASHREQFKYSEDDELGEFEACVEKPLVSPGDDPVSSLTASMSSMSHFGSSYPVQGSASADNQTLTFIQLRETGDSSAPQMFTATAPGGSTFQIISEPDTNPASFLVTSANPGVALSQPEESSLYQCGDCGKRFFKEDHLKDHLVVHRKAKPFVCHLCGKAFSRANAMRKHEKTHLKRCKICDAAFPFKYELDIHMDMHRTYTF